MGDFEFFVYGLIALAWIVFQVIRRVLKPPRPLGTIAEEMPHEASAPQEPQPHARVPRVPRAPDSPAADSPAPGPYAPLPRGPESHQPPPQAPLPPLDTQWGRHPTPEPAPAAGEPFGWSVDAAQAELQVAREVARRQARARRQAVEAVPRRRHPNRPRLRSLDDLRNAVVLSAVIGPCRAMEPWQSPQDPR